MHCGERFNILFRSFVTAIVYPHMRVKFIETIFFNI